MIFRPRGGKIGLFGAAARKHFHDVPPFPYSPLFRRRWRARKVLSLRSRPARQAPRLIAGGHAHARPATRTNRRDQNCDERAFQRELLLPRRACARPGDRGALARSCSRHTMPRPASIPPPFLQGRFVRPSMRALCAVIEEMRPAVVSFHFGLPSADLLSRVKATGALLLSSATTVPRRAGLKSMAQRDHCPGPGGWWTSGHVSLRRYRRAAGSFSPSCRKCATPCACLFCGRRDRRRARDCGGLCAWRRRGPIGTAYLRTPEATVSPMHRAALAHARDDATRLTNVFTGRPARGLINRFVAEVGPMSTARAAIPVGRGSRGAAPGGGRKIRQRRLFSALGRRGRGARPQEGAEALTRRMWAEGRAVMTALNGRPLRVKDVHLIVVALPPRRRSLVVAFLLRNADRLGFS